MIYHQAFWLKIKRGGPIFEYYYRWIQCECYNMLLFPDDCTSPAKLHHHRHDDIFIEENYITHANNKIWGSRIGLRTRWRLVVLQHRKTILWNAQHSSIATQHQKILINSVVLFSLNYFIIVSISEKYCNIRPST